MKRIYRYILGYFLALLVEIGLQTTDNTQVKPIWEMILHASIPVAIVIIIDICKFLHSKHEVKKLQEI